MGDRDRAEVELEPYDAEALQRDIDEARELAASIKQVQLSKEHLASLERGRESLLDQIRQSEETIERSMELIRQVDEPLARRLKP
jgi:hypothetical protein